MNLYKTWRKWESVYTGVISETMSFFVTHAPTTRFTYEHTQQQHTIEIT